MANKIEMVTGEDEENESGGSEDGQRSVALANERIERRVEAAREKQAELSDRFARLRGRLMRAGGVELSAKEKAWAAEVERLAREVSPPENGEKGCEEERKENGAALPWQRVEEVRNLKEDLVGQAKEVANESGDAAPTPAVRVPADFRKAKVAQVRELLDRETALVEAAAEKLDRLSIAI